MYYRQPRYFADFRCLGGSCKNNCCFGWQIRWEKEEIDKVKNAENASQEIIKLCESTFMYNEESKQYIVKFDENGRCPFLTTDNFCKIQRELGVEYMSNTCMVYPRRYLLANNIFYRSNYMSCSIIMNRLLNDEKSMDLINLPIKETVTYNPVAQSIPQQLKSHPELKYRSELLEFFYNLISDKRHDVETNIILGGLAAQSLTRLVGKGEYGRIPEALKAFNKQVHNGSQLKAIGNIQPNYSLRFGFIAELSEEIIGFSGIDSFNDETGTLNIDIYNAAERKLLEIFKDRLFFTRNIALNLLFEQQVPFKFEDKTIFENYSLFVTSYACLKLNLISVANIGHKINLHIDKQHFEYEGDERFVGVSSTICRSICQNTAKAKFIIDRLNENKFNSPAYLALLIK